MDSNSSQILRRLQSGGTQELTDLFTCLRSHLRNLVETRLDRRLSPRVDASDIVQEAFVRASNTLDGYLKSPEMHPVVWLRLIAKHVVTETHRRHFRDKRSPLREQNWDHENEDPLVNSLADSMRSVGSTLENRELFEKVRAKLALLGDNDREMLEMRHVDGLSLEETATSLELTIDAAKKRYYRALKRFKEIACELI